MVALMAECPLTQEEDFYLRREVERIARLGVGVVLVEPFPLADLFLPSVASLEEAAWMGYLVLSPHPYWVERTLALGGRGFLYLPLARDVRRGLPYLRHPADLLRLWEVEHGARTEHERRGQQEVA